MQKNECAIDDFINGCRDIAEAEKTKYVADFAEKLLYNPGRDKIFEHYFEHAGREAAYKKLSLHFHPDKYPDASESQKEIITNIMKVVNSARKSSWAIEVERRGGSFTHSQKSEFEDIIKKDEKFETEEYYSDLQESLKEMELRCYNMIYNDGVCLSETSHKNLLFTYHNIICFITNWGATYNPIWLLEFSKQLEEHIGFIKEDMAKAGVDKRLQSKILRAKTKKISNNTLQSCNKPSALPMRAEALSGGAKLAVICNKSDGSDKQLIVQDGAIKPKNSSRIASTKNCMRVGLTVLSIALIFTGPISWGVFAALAIAKIIHTTAKIVVDTKLEASRRSDLKNNFSRMYKKLTSDFSRVMKDARDEIDDHVARAKQLELCEQVMELTTPYFKQRFDQLAALTQRTEAEEHSFNLLKRGSKYLLGNTASNHAKRSIFADERAAKYLQAETLMQISEGDSVKPRGIA